MKQRTLDMEEMKKDLALTYDKYQKAKKSKMVQLTRILRYFRLKIDKTRINDYQIIKLEWLKEPILILIDTKENILYQSKYYYDHYSHQFKYIKNKISGSLREREDYYAINNSWAYATNLTFKLDNEKLIFKKENPYPPNYPIPQFNQGITILYQKDLEEEECLEKTYQSYDEGRCYASSYEKVCSNEKMALQEETGWQNRYTYTNQNSLIYGIDTFNDTYKCAGFLFTNSHILEPYKFFPESLKACCPERLFHDSNTYSALIFRVIRPTDFNNIEIYKTKEGFKVYLRICHFAKNNTIENKEFGFPVLKNGKIAEEELSYITKNLESHLDPEVMQIFVSYLNSAAEKMTGYQDLEESQKGTLSAKTFLSKSADEIVKTIEAKKEYYFSLASKEYNDLAFKQPANSRILK